MPIYEEKLISPLAIRFTQQRIRTTFKDGQEVEATIKEIAGGAGVGEYDVILEAPFPIIEIIRWSAGGRGAGKTDNWFTFDNRRLYCLQRVAADYWPKRVAVAVHVLYADAGAIRKKLDSKTLGLSVSIGHAFASADELQQWAWREAVRGRAPPGLEVSMQAEAVISSDDVKASVADLLDAPITTSSAMNELEKVDVSPTEVSTPQGNDLALLIGQLLNLQKKDCVPSPRKISEESCSTRSPCGSSTPDDSIELDLADALMLPRTPPGLMLAEATAPPGPMLPQDALMLPRTPPGLMLAEATAPPGLMLPQAPAEATTPPALAAPPGVFFPVKAETTPLAKDAGAAEAAPRAEGSLTNLIGQLLDLESKDPEPARKRTDSQRAAVCKEYTEEPSDATPLRPGPVSLDPALKQRRAQAQAQAAYAANVMQWQRAQWQAAQLAQVAQAQAYRARQAMSFYAAQTAMQSQAYPRCP